MKKRLIILVIACSAIFKGCASEPAPQDIFYRMDPKMPKKLVSRSLVGTVLVNPLGARGFTNSRPIVYVDPEKNLRVKQYRYYLWAETPTVMVQDLIVRGLRSTSVFHYVITPAERAKPDWIVSGNLLRMEHIRSGNDGISKVIVEMELGIIDAENRKPVLLKCYRETENVLGQQMDQVVTAFESTLGRLIHRFSTDSLQVFRKTFTEGPSECH